MLHCLWDYVCTCRLLQNALYLTYSVSESRHPAVATKHIHHPWQFLLINELLLEEYFTLMRASSNTTRHLYSSTAHKRQNDPKEEWLFSYYPLNTLWKVSSFYPSASSIMYEVLTGIWTATSYTKDTEIGLAVTCKHMSQPVCHEKMQFCFFMDDANKWDQIVCSR